MAARALVYRRGDFKFGRDNRMCDVNHILHHRRREVEQLKKRVASTDSGSLDMHNKDVYEMMLAFLRKEKIAHYHYAKCKEHFYKIKFDKQVENIEAG